MTAGLSTIDPFHVGALVGGRYRIVSLLGEGGVGRVYRATHVELETDVALKTLRPEMAQRDDIVQRFQREARACVRLRSEHIARVHDVGSHDGQPFFVMEYLEGCDLATHAKTRTLPLTTLAELVIHACEGLAVAHANQIIHRDIKPENLFVVRDDKSAWESLKVLDFGISKIALTNKITDMELRSSRTETMMGSPHYISPEQIRSTHDVDHRTDIWSLGVVLFEIASGQMPFREDRDLTALVAEILERPHRQLVDVLPSVPVLFSTIIDRCLEKNPDRRYQNAAELAAALLPLAPKRARASVERASAALHAAGLGTELVVNSTFPPPVETRSSMPVAATPSQAPRVSAPVPPLEEAPTTSEVWVSRSRFVVALAVLVAMIVALSALWLRNTKPASPATPEPSASTGTVAAIAQPAPTPAPEPTPAPTPSAAPVETTSTAAASLSVTAVKPPPLVTRASAAPRSPGASTPRPQSSPPTTGLEIRHER